MHNRPIWNWYNLAHTKLQAFLALRASTVPMHLADNYHGHTITSGMTMTTMATNHEDLVDGCLELVASHSKRSSIHPDQTDIDSSSSSSIINGLAAIRILIDRHPPIDRPYIDQSQTPTLLCVSEDCKCLLINRTSITRNEAVGRGVEWNTMAINRRASNGFIR